VKSEDSELQTDGAEHRKARVVSSVLVNGTMSGGVSDVSGKQHLLLPIPCLYGSADKTAAVPLRESCSDVSTCTCR